MDDKTKISPRFITGNIGQITAFEEPGGTPSHPKSATIYSQEIISWDILCFVLVSKHITATQQPFLEDSG